MPVLPIPMIIALLLAGLLVRAIATRETHITLLALIASCAVQSALIALIQYYGVTSLHPVQPLLAMLIPPLAWFAFLQAAEDESWAQHGWMHAGGLVLAAILLVWQPAWLDALIPISFAAYGAAMLLRLAQGEDSLPHSRLESGALPVLAWRVIAVSLLASAGCDILIAWSLAAGGRGPLLWVPSLVSSLSLLSLGILGLSHAIESRRDGNGETAAASKEDAERDQAVIAKLDAYVASHKPFLDPDLTLARLSRKILVPAKPLSTAINRIKGENVSRYINRHRIEHAAALLAAGQPVTATMLESGFNTKSNFNREFLRVKGKSPTEWLAAQQVLRS